MKLIGLKGKKSHIIVMCVKELVLTGFIGFGSEIGLNLGTIDLDKQ